MTTTTKVFVILVCLFAFIFTPMAIQFAARSNNWRQTAEDFRDLAESAYANERSVAAISASEIDHYRLLLDEEHQRFRDSQQRIAKLEQEAGELTQAKAELERKWDSCDHSNRVLLAEKQVETAHNEELSKTKERALASERDLRVNNNRLNDRVKELSAQLVVVTQQLNQKVQEITAISEENTQLRRSLNLGKAGAVATVTPTPSAQAAAPSPASPIRCKVTQVDGQLATISAGRASGLQEGMVMVVLRGKDYVCDLTITSSITPNEAVARIKLESTGKRIQEGDEVVDELSFTGR